MLSDKTPVEAITSFSCCCPIDDLTICDNSTSIQAITGHDMSDDPYSEHPGLRGKIIDPMTSYFRQNDLRDVMLANPQTAPFWHLLHSPQTRRASRDETLADHCGDLWVFAYGSLMWNPALRYDKVLRAHAPDHARAFILRDIYGGRGTEETPGLMAALDTGNGCDGLVFRVPEAIIDEETDILWAREFVGPGYCPQLIETETSIGPVQALAFLADHKSPIMAPDITRQEQVECIATGVGFMGSSLEYIAGIKEQFDVLDICDPMVDSLLHDALAYRDTLAAAS